MTRVEAALPTMCRLHGNGEMAAVKTTVFRRMSGCA